jgi:hypothetical protein
MVNKMDNKLRNELREQCKFCKESSVTAGTENVLFPHLTCKECKDRFILDHKSDKETLDIALHCLMNLAIRFGHNDIDIKQYKLHRVRVLLSDLYKEYGYADKSWNGIWRLFNIDLSNISEYTFEDYVDDNRVFWRRYDRRYPKNIQTKLTAQKRIGSS